MGLIFNVTSGKNNNKRNNGLPKPVTRKVKKPDDLMTTALRFRSNILSKEICTSHSAFCQSRIKNVDSEYANSISSRRFRAKRKEKSSNLIAESQIKRPLGFMIFNRSSVISDNCTIIRGKKIENCFPRFESDSLLSCNFDSSSDFTKSFQRRSEKYVMQAVMPIMKKYTGDYAHVSADAVSLEQATSALISNNPRLNCTHHKTKCRSSKPYRNQFRGTAVVAVGKATNRAKQMTVFPNIALIRKLSPTGSCAAKIISAQTLITSVTNRSVSPTSTGASVMPTLAGTLLDVPVFSQLWQQLVKLLGNSVAGITSPYRFSKEHVRSTLKTARKTTKISKAVDQLQKHSTTSESILTGTATCSKITVSAIPTAPSGCSSSRTKSRLLPSVGTTSFFTLLTLICLETVLLSTVSNCAKTFYMHWNTSNSIFRIDNTDHIIDVNKGNLAFEFDQVHIICPVYEPGTFENETEKYIIYNVSKVEYETCRITNADPRVIAICDKPQKLMFFTITFRPFTPQPGGLEFLPGNDYYFISTSSKDDLYRRIGGRCSTNNMKVVFKVCCAPEEKNKTTTVASSSIGTSLSGSSSAGGFGININSADGSGKTTSIENSANIDIVNTQANINQHMNSINTIGINGVNTGLMPIGGVNIGVSSGIGTNNGGMQMKPMNGASGTSINTNIDQFNRIPIQDGGVNAMGNNIGGLGGHGSGSIILTPGHGGINMISSGGSIGIGQYPGHPGQTGIRINNVASQQHHATHKNNNYNDGHYDKHPNEAVKNEELTYNSGAMSIHPWPIWRAIGKAIRTPICKMFSWLLNRCMTRTLKSSTAEFEMCSRCDKNQQQLETYMSPHVRSVFYRGEREFQPLLPGIVKFKYLILNYKKIITCLIGTISATIYILKISVNTRADIYTAVLGNPPNLPNTVKIESNLSSSAKNAVVPHLVLDTLYSNVNEKLASIEFKYALVEPIIIGSIGLTFLSAQGTSANASASIYFASNTMQYFIDVRKADKSTSNIILLYLQLFNGYRSHIPSVSVKVKKFR